MKTVFPLVSAVMISVAAFGSISGAAQAEDRVRVITSPIDKPVVVSEQGSLEERLKLSRDLHDIRTIRDRINDTIEATSQNVPKADRPDYERYIATHVDYDALEVKSIQYVADTFSVGELKAMIAYFGSADGQSAEAKSPQYAEKIGKDILKEIDAALAASKYDGVKGNSAPKIGGQSTPKMPLSGVTPDLLMPPKK